MLDGRDGGVGGGGGCEVGKEEQPRKRMMNYKFTINRALFS